MQNQDFQVDDVVNGRYRVQDILGKPGKFAVTYKVFDQESQQDLVLRLMKQVQFSQHFYDEQELFKAIPEHTAIVKSIATGQLPDGRCFAIFLYQGSDLARRFHAGPLSAHDSLRFAVDVARGLTHLHHHRIYHLDIKPSNLICTPEGTKIIDFNVAYAESLERNLVLAGTSLYRPPESHLPRDQTTAKMTSAQLSGLDIYALAVTLFQSLTGQLPFPSDAAPLLRKPTCPRRLPNGRPFPQDIARVLMTAFAPDPKDRYRSASDFGKDVAELFAKYPQEQEPTTDKRLFTPWDKPPEVTRALDLYNQASALQSAAVVLIDQLAAPGVTWGEATPEQRDIMQKAQVGFSTDPASYPQIHQQMLKAESLYRDSIQLLNQVPSYNPSTREAVYCGLISLLKDMGRTSEAEQLEAKLDSGNN